MKHLRIAGKRIQPVELYFYLLSTVVTAVAFVVAVFLREAASPVLFRPYVPSLADAALMIAGAMLPKILMRVYEHKTAASRLMHLQLHVTAATLFFFAMILVFYLQPTTRIPISIVLIFIAVDLAAAILLMPVYHRVGRAAAESRKIAVMADEAIFEGLAHHRLALQGGATFARLGRDELRQAVGAGANTNGHAEKKPPFEQIVLDRQSSAHVPDWSELLKARDAGVVIQTPEAFLESEFGEALTDEDAAYDIIMASSTNGNQLRVAIKRVFDWFVASGLALALLPVALLAGLAVWLEDQGPVFYEQLRIGLNGRPFRILKFRSMVEGAEKLGPESTAVGDTRVTRVGRVMRRTRIDEIPQLINVLKGEMSMVGPRPQTPGNVEAWSKATPLYQLRHLVKPGVTGWAQVRFAYVATAEDARIKLAYDLYYVKNYSMILDALVLMLTPRIVLAGLGGR